MSALSEAELFMRYDYAEMKDLLKTFITVVSATIVFSLTFSDKIIKYDHSSVIIRRIVVSSWLCMIISLISAGASIVLIASAAGKMLYGSIPYIDYGSWILTSWSVASALIAGVIFVISLLLLIVAVALASHMNNPSNIDHPADLTGDNNSK